MARTYWGSGVLPRRTVSNVNGAYWRPQDIGLLRIDGYLAQPGDRITHLYYNRGGQPGAGTNMSVYLVESDTSNIADGQVVDTRRWSLPIGTAWVDYHEIRFSTPFVPQAGKYYWFMFRGLPNAYANASATKIAGTHKIELASTGTPTPTSMAGLSWGSANPYGAVLGVMLSNTANKTVVQLTAPCAFAAHIARDYLTGYADQTAFAALATGLWVRYTDYTAEGDEVEIRPDGSFKLYGMGTQTFGVEFSADGGTTWSAQQTVTFQDATDAT